MQFEDYTIREVFKQLLQAFTKQNVKMLLDTATLFNYDAIEEIWQPNEHHPLFKSNQFRIMMRYLVTTFLRLPRCQNIYPVRNPVDRDPSKIPKITSVEITEVINAVDFEVDREIEKYIPDLTMSPITAVTGDKYESDDVEGMCAVFSAQPLKYEAFLSGFYRIDVGEKAEFDIKSIHAHRKFLNLSSQGKKRKPDLDSCAEHKSSQQCLVYERINDTDGVHYKLVGFAERRCALESLPGILFFSGSRWGFSLPMKKQRSDGKLSPKPEPQCIAVYHDGHYCLPDYPAKDFQHLERKWLKLYLGTYNTSVKNTAYTVLQAVQWQKKGALVILSEDRVMGEIAKSVQLSQMGIRMSCPNLLNLAKNTEYLSSFSSIDGAVLLDFAGQCHAIGAIIGGEPDATVKGDIGRGSRYNSARNFLAWAAKRYPGVLFLSIIVSEDGIIDVLP